MDQLRPLEGKKFLARVTGDRTIGAVGVQVRVVRPVHREADRGVGERDAEPFLTVAQRRLGLLPFSDVAHEGAHADNMASFVDNRPRSQTYRKYGSILADIFLLVFGRFAARKNVLPHDRRFHVVPDFWGQLLISQTLQLFERVAEHLLVSRVGFENMAAHIRPVTMPSRLVSKERTVALFAWPQRVQACFALGNIYPIGKSMMEPL